jgi:hypothetical protein
MIPGVMLQDLIGKDVEVWIRGGRPDGPTFGGTLQQAIVQADAGQPSGAADEEEATDLFRGAPVVFLILRDGRNIEVRIPGEHVTAVVSAHG